MIVAVVMALTAIRLPTTARADGDPASDVLAVQNAFLPADAGASVRQQEQLITVVRQAVDRGLAIRVAVISSPSDLGSVSALWHRPQPYAEFLGQELSLIFSGQVLVVMPNGFGLYHAGLHTTGELAALARTSTRDSNLVAVAIDAVRQLAASTGHALPQSAFGAASPGGRTGSGPSALAWGVLAAGGVLVALAWVVSLRAVPPRRFSHRTSPQAGR